MAVLETRGSMNRKDKIWGILPDRVIVGRHVADKTFAPLSLTDPRRDFIFVDFKVDENFYKNTSGYLNYYRDTTATASSYANFALISLASQGEIFALDRNTPPLCYSSCLAGIRDYYTAHYYINNHIGNFKGPNPIFTIDNTGTGTDYLVPGMKILVSTGGIIHKYVANEAIEVFYHKTASIGNDPFGSNNALSGNPIMVGQSQRSAPYGNPYKATKGSNAGTFPVCTSGNPARINQTIFSKLIGQDATYVYYMQLYDDYGNVTNYQVNTSTWAPSDFIEVVSIRKSDSFLTDLPMTASQVNSLTSIGGILTKEVVTTEATPARATFVLLIAGYQKAILSFNKIVNNTWTNIGSLALPNAFDRHNKMYPTQLMENLQSGYSDYWKLYLPTMTSTDNSLVPVMIRQRKTLAAAPTQVNCTITNLPTEYASTDGTKIKYFQTPSWYDASWCAEIYDNGDQYIAYWIGRTHCSYTRSDANTLSYSEVSDTKYRYFLVFKVDATDDSKLIYQSCIPEFKTAKPIHCAVASPDNKHIVVANEDKVMCFAWSTTVKGFVCVDDIALPGVVALGMDEVNSTGRNTVWAEVLENTSLNCDSKSYLVQIDFGDYEDVDLRYYTGSTYINDFGKITLPVTQDGLGDYSAKTATFEVRVKNKVDSVETSFVTGKSVKLRIEGVKDSDQVSFVGYDSGIPLQKTITSTSDWLTFTINYKYPITNFKIVSEII